MKKMIFVLIFREGAALQNNHKNQSSFRSATAVPTLSGHTMLSNVHLSGSGLKLKNSNFKNDKINEYESSGRYANEKQLFCRKI